MNIHTESIFFQMFHTLENSEAGTTEEGAIIPTLNEVFLFIYFFQKLHSFLIIHRDPE